MSVPRRAALAGATALPFAFARPSEACLGPVEAREAARFAALCRQYAHVRAEVLDADRRLDAAITASGFWQTRVHDLQDRLSEIAEAIENAPTATPDEAAQQAAIIADERRVLRGEVSL